MTLAKQGEAPAGGLPTVAGGLSVLGWIRIGLELSKARITVAVTLTVATGHLLFTGGLRTSVLAPMAGVFLLACGSAALNQVQEAKTDARMRRTRGRPIPTGRISREWALLFALALVGAGFYVLASIERHTLTLLFLGGLALIWYNGVYLALKRLTAFAVVPGALVGSIPPMIGWSAAGGLPLDPSIIDLALFFFIWQVPHFWLLLLRNTGDYQAAGLPSLNRLVSTRQYARITCMWILAVAVSGVLLAAGLGVRFPWNVGVLVASLWLGVAAFRFLGADRASQACMPAFMRINAYALVVMIMLSGNAIL